MEMRAILGLSAVMPILTLADAADAVPVARALVAGGAKTIELTLRTDAALDAMRAIAAEVPELVIGAGTVLRPGDMDAAVDAGASFLISPGLTPSLIAAAAERGVPYLPGVATAAEVMMALEQGHDCLKLFPAAQLGVATLKAFAGPFARVAFCANGGVTRDNARDFLALPNVLTVGCSWIVPDKAVAEKDWAAIEANARIAAALSNH